MKDTPVVIYKEFMAELEKDNDYYYSKRSIMRDKNLGAVARMVYNLIYYYTEKKDGQAKRCTISNKFIAEELGFDISTIKRALNELLEKKYIIFIKYHNNKMKREIMRYDPELVSRERRGHLAGFSFYVVYKL